MPPPKANLDCPNLYGHGCPTAVYSKLYLQQTSPPPLYFPDTDKHVSVAEGKRRTAQTVLKTLIVSSSNLELPKRVLLCTALDYVLCILDVLTHISTVSNERSACFY